MYRLKQSARADILQDLDRYIDERDNVLTEDRISVSRSISIALINQLLQGKTISEQDAKSVFEGVDIDKRSTIGLTVDVTRLAIKRSIKLWTNYAKSYLEKAPQQNSDVEAGIVLREMLGPNYMDELQWG